MSSLSLILDQIQSGLGTKDDRMLALGGKTSAIGPAMMFEPYLKEEGISITASLYCGDGTYEAGREEVTKKLIGMTRKLQPDVTLIGPCFNYPLYSRMAAELCEAFSRESLKVFCAMSAENEELIETYKNKILIVKMPKKGGTGLTQSLRQMLSVAGGLAGGLPVADLKARYCY